MMRKAVGGVRKRASDATTTTTTTTTTNNTQTLSAVSLSSSCGEEETTSKSKGNPHHAVIWWFLHTFALSVVLYGLWLGKEFHTGTECEMTYSRRIFLPIFVPTTTKTTTTTTDYKLFKFVDARDPRHLSLISTKNTLSHGYCNNQTAAVIFVPGHWGSYTQCRSLGAHGTQMTGRTHQRMAWEALAGGSWSDRAHSIENFVFDVYCVDFGEEGGALHGSFLRHQTEFLATVIMTLVQNCNLMSVTLVGHSVGGLVATAVPAFYPMTERYIAGIITLATPHSSPPFTMEKSVYEFYEEMAGNAPQLVLSVCGGLRDELIPHQLCLLPNGITIAATEIMVPGSNIPAPRFGMDHKAIVWCHNLLVVIRIIIFHIFRIQDDDNNNNLPAKERLDYIKNHISSLKRRRSGQEEMALLQGLVLQSAAFYNSGLFITLYFLLGVFGLAFSKTASPSQPFAWMAPVVVAGFGYLFSDFPYALVVVVNTAYLANLVFWCLKASLLLIPPTKYQRSLPRVLFLQLGWLGMLSVLIHFLSVYYFSSTGVHTVFVAGILCTILFTVSMVRSDPHDVQNVTTATMIIGVLPCITFGKLVAAHDGMLAIVLLLLPLLLRVAVGEAWGRRNPDWASLYVLSALVLGPSMMKHGHKLADLLSVICIIGTLRCVFANP